MAIASRTYDEDESREREIGGAVDRAIHSELGAQWRSVAMAVTMTHNVALPLLEWWC